MQFLARLKAHCFTGRNSDLGAGPRISAYARLTRSYVKDTKAAEFNSIPLGQSSFHGLEDGFYCHFRFGFGDAGSVYYFVYDVEFDQKSSR